MGLLTVRPLYRYRIRIVDRPVVRGPLEMKPPLFAYRAPKTLDEAIKFLAGDADARVLDQEGRPLAFARPSFSHF